MNKLSISYLIMLILDEENTSILRNNALTELKKRAYKYGLNYNDLIKIDEGNINLRGFDANNYLLSKNTGMQELMDSYFTNIYSGNNRLLLSETNLCNNFGEFFDNVTLKEIKNINNRLKNNNLSINERQRLLKVKDILRSRYNTKGNAFFSNDDIYILLNCLNFDFNSEENRTISNSDLHKRSMLAKLIENEYFKYFHIFKIIKEDMKKLSYQKRNILNQVKHGYNVNYNSPEIDKVILKKIKK